MILCFLSWLESIAGLGCLAASVFLFIFSWSVFGFGQLYLWALLLVSIGVLFLLLGAGLRYRRRASVWINVLVLAWILFVPPQISLSWIRQSLLNEKVQSVSIARLDIFVAAGAPV